MTIKTYHCQHCSHTYTWNPLDLSRHHGHSPTWCNHCHSDISDSLAKNTPDRMNRVLLELIGSGRPYAAVRFGNTEANVIISLLAGNRLSEEFKLHWLELAAGVWPTDDQFLAGEFLLSNQFSYLNSDIIGFVDNSHIDLFKVHLGVKQNVWARGNHIFLTPNYITGTCWPNQDKVWTEGLVDKRVLVVSPFKQSIEFQWARISKVWGKSHEKICPYSLVGVIKAPHAPKVEGYALSFQGRLLHNWLQTIYALLLQISRVDFDVAFVGAGAMSPVIACGIKAMGKGAITLNSHLQLHFGISGRRWNEFYPAAISSHFNPYWLHRPFKEDSPANSHITPENAYF